MVLLLHLLQYPQEVLVGQVVVEEQTRVLLDLEILHQHHHHKEIMVERGNLVALVQAAEEVVLVVLEVMQLVHHLLLEVVEMEQHLLFPEHQ
jgi:hypothetical protein